MVMTAVPLLMETANLQLPPAVKTIVSGSYLDTVSRDLSPLQGPHPQRTVLQPQGAKIGPLQKNFEHINADAELGRHCTYIQYIRL